MTMDPKACEFCAEMFVPKSMLGRICSERCRQAEYRRANPDKVKTKNAKYRQANADKIAVYAAQYRQDNAERVAEYAAQYRRDNAEMLKSVCAERDRYQDALRLIASSYMHRGHFMHSKRSIARAALDGDA